MKRIFITVIAMFSAVVMLACGNGNSSNEQPNKPHTHYYGQWIINKSATCTQDGNKYRTCACGDTQRETITATGHTGVGVCSGCRVVFNDLLFDSINPKSYPFEYDSMLYQFNFSKDENSTITLNGTAKYTSSYAYLLGSYECTVNLKNDETWAYYTKYTTSNGSGGTVSCWIKGSVPLTKSAQFTKKRYVIPVDSYGGEITTDMMEVLHDITIRFFACFTVEIDLATEDNIGLSVDNFGLINYK